MKSKKNHELSPKPARKMTMQTIIGRDIEKAVALLKNDDLVAVPTETVYGLAGNGFSEEAVKKIFSVKNRPSSDPLILHTNNPGKIREWVWEFPEIAGKLLEQFAPGPLTLVLPRNPVISDKVTAGKETAAFRIPNHPLLLELLSRLSFPLAAPSANPFGYVSPVSAAHVSAQLGGKIPYILDGGRCNVGIESTIVEIREGKVVLLREGGVSREALHAVTGNKLVIGRPEDKEGRTPGYLKSHYATHKPLYLGNIEELSVRYKNQRAGYIFFKESIGIAANNPVWILSPTGSTDEAGRNLFTAMRELDEHPDVDIIIAEAVPETGIGRAVNERLKKAGFSGNS